MLNISMLPGLPGSLAARDQPAREPGPGEVLVRVLAVPLTRRDFTVATGAAGAEPAPGESFLVLGSEAIGQVELLGAGAAGVRRGDRVVLLPRRGDGCVLCASGEVDACRGQPRERGLRRVSGTLSEYVVVPAGEAVRAPRRLASLLTVVWMQARLEKALEAALSLQRRIPWTPHYGLALGDRLAVPLEVASLASLGAAVRAEPELPGGGPPLLDTDEAPDLVLLWGSAPLEPVVLAAGGILVQQADEGAGMAARAAAPGDLAVMRVGGANRRHYQRALRSLAVFEARWPGWLRAALPLRRVPLRGAVEALQRGEPGVVVEFSPV